MARKKKIKIKGIVITKSTAIMMAIVLAFGVVAYFVYEPFRKQVDGFLSSLFSEPNNSLNSAKGENELRFHMIDIGQGDCLFIEFPDDTVMLIDTGEKSNARADKIINYIKNYEKTTIDYFMLTHTDSDHIGNTVAILEAFEVKKAFIPDVENKTITKTYENSYNAIIAEGCEVEISSEFDTISSTDPNNVFYFAFLSPWQSLYNDLNGTSDPTSHQKNDVSPIIYLEYMQKRILLTGDVNIAVEDELITHYNDHNFEKFAIGGEEININLRKIDILKVAHHGSEGSSGANFLGVVEPTYSIISAGLGNSYYHPRAEAINRLKNVNSTIYTTVDNGSIQATIKPVLPPEEETGGKQGDGAEPNSVATATEETPKQYATIEWWFEKSNSSTGVECTQGITPPQKTAVIIKIKREEFIYSNGYQVA